MVILTQLVLSVVAFATQFSVMYTQVNADPDDMGVSAYNTARAGRTSSFLSNVGAISKADLKGPGHIELRPTVRPGGAVPEMSVFAFDRHRLPEKAQLPQIAWQTAWCTEDSGARVQLLRLGDAASAKKERGHESYVNSRWYTRILDTGGVTPMFPSMRLVCSRKGA